MKRSAKPLGRDQGKTTFIFVTPQRFVRQGRVDDEKEAFGVWHDVVAIDGDDLVHWLKT